MLSLRENERERNRGREHLRPSSQFVHASEWCKEPRSMSVVVYKRQSNIDIIPEDDYYTEVAARKRPYTFTFFDLPVRFLCISPWCNCAL